MMANSEGKIMLLIGEAFIETSEEDANECKIIKFCALIFPWFVYCMACHHGTQFCQ